jgi:hypothetical protein
MNPTELLVAYAADFEASFIDDEWTRLEKYFAPTAVYEVKGISAFTCRIEGPAAIFAGMKKSLDGFDRALDSRTIAITSELDETADGVDLDWKVTYTKAGAPPFELIGHTFVRVLDGKIVELVDSYTPEMDKTAIEWVLAYAPGLTGSYV